MLLEARIFGLGWPCQVGCPGPRSPDGPTKLDRFGSSGTLSEYAGALKLIVRYTAPASMNSRICADQLKMPHGSVPSFGSRHASAQLLSPSIAPGGEYAPAGNLPYASW